MSGNLIGLAWVVLVSLAQHSEEVRLLREQGVKTDNRHLLEFLRLQTPGPKDQQQIEQALQDLGHRNFSRRDRASRMLVTRGAVAVEALRRAVKQKDPEVVRRALECLDEIERGPGSALPLAVLRLIAARKTPDAVPVLLAYAPFGNDERIQEELVTTLLALGAARQAPPAVLVQALSDAHPDRRGLAGQVLGQHREASVRAQALPLLKDGHLMVRYRTAFGLLHGGERSSVVALIDLLGDAPDHLTWRIEEVLLRLVSDEAPQVPGISNGEKARAKYREAWLAWWKQNGASADLSRIQQQRPFLNLTVVPEMHANKIWEFGPDGKIRWELASPDLNTPIDAQILPGGRVLVAELNGNRVTERDSRGKILWQHAVQTPIAIERLANGNTFIATNHQVTIVTPKGEAVFSYKPAQDFFMHSVQRMPHGGFVTVSMAGVVREVNAAGQVVRDISVQQEGGSWSGIEWVSAGRYLVSGSNKVLEIDSTGKVLWRFEKANACYASRLPNGRTLVVDNSKGILEVDRTGKVVSERAISSLWRAHRR